jgi:hypothetical protein
MTQIVICTKLYVNLLLNNKGFYLLLQNSENTCKTAL